MIRNILVACLIVLLSACVKTEPLYDVENEVIVTGSGNVPTIDQVRAVILQAVLKKGWRIAEEAPNNFEATLSKGRKIVRITISFTTTEYSIRYKSSQNLLYDGSVIHRRYNDWIEGLRKKINIGLSLL